MIAFFLLFVSSYKKCPEKTVLRTNRTMFRKVKGGHWTYFYIKRGLLEKSMYMVFNTTKKTSFYIGEGDRCPYIDTDPFYVSGPVRQQFANIPKLPKTRKFPIAVRSEDDAIVHLNIYGEIGFGFYSITFIIIPGIALACAAIYGIYRLIKMIPARKKVHYSKKSRMAKR